jgi:hypothetical protein
LRFAVHRPGNPVASPRSHGEPRRDVPSCVHVSVAGETAGRTYEARLALARLRIHVPARRAALTAERGTDGQPQSVTTVRSPASAGKPTFQVVKPLTLLRGQARCMQQLASRQGRRHHDAPVNAYGQIVTRRKNRTGNYGEGDMPAPGPVTRHSVRLHAGRYDTRPTKTHPSGLRYPNLSNLPAEPTHMPRLHGDDPESIVPASFPPCRPAMGTGEEIRHGLGEVPQRLLLHHLGACGQPGMLFPYGGELTALLKVTWRTRPAPAPVRMLLHSQVPHEPGMCAVVPQRAFLSGRGTSRYRDIRTH